MDRKVHDKKSSECNCLNLRRASQAITEVYDEFISPSGVKTSQFALLKHINNLAPVSVSDLALHIRLDRMTLVRNLKLIEERGFVIDISADGTRNRQLKLTDTGIQVLQTADRLWLEAQNFMEQYLGKDDMSTLTILLSKIEAITPELYLL